MTVTSNLNIQTFFSFDFSKWEDHEDLILEFLELNSVNQGKFQSNHCSHYYQLR